MGITPEQLTQRFRDVGLPATLPQEQKDAWEAYKAGRGAPVRLLPKNGGLCTAWTRSALVCGRELLIDGSCYGDADHQRRALRREAVVPVDRLRTFASGLRQVPPGHDHYGLLKDTADALDELLDELLEDGS